MSRWSSSAALRPSVRPVMPWRRGLSGGSARVHTLFMQSDRCWRCGDADAIDVFDGFASFARQHAGADVSVVLSGALTHQLIVPDDLPLPDEEALVAWARHQLVHYHGGAAQRWPLATWVSTGQRGVSALHGLDVTALFVEAVRHQVRIAVMRPWWSTGLQVASRLRPTLQRAARAELWLIESEGATQLHCRSGRLVALDQRWLDTAQGDSLAQQLDEHTAREAEVFALGFGGQRPVLPSTVDVVDWSSAAHPLPAWVGR